MKLKTTRHVLFLLLGVFAALMLAMILTGNASFGYAAIVPVLIFGVVDVLFWKCPHCNKPLGPLVGVSHCMKCGEEIKF